jgi:pyruvate-ferredoxin/flavodoxin oxidoreductase
MIVANQTRGEIRIVDGNEAAASVAYRLNEAAAIYPITPSSPMGELADEWASRGRTNVWGTVPRIVEMQSEGGAAGAVHGALQAGALATTFTASQGLLLMVPNMFKIAGELTPFVMHVAARTLATHALSIFGDHSDVMAARMTGFALLASTSVQEAHDLACVAQMATLASRIPFLHFFDGFRTSHELGPLVELSDDDLRALVDEELVQAHRDRALTPDRPSVRGTAQNPDAFFQAREAANPFYDACPAIVERALERFAERTGRSYRLFDYVGHPEAERVLVLMGSGAGAATEAVERLVSEGERVGLLVVRLYRPFSAAHLLASLPASAKRVAVLDRTKEPGALADPLHLDVLAALTEAGRDVELVIGGRYGLSSKEFTPAMAKAALDELDAAEPKKRFTVGIVDDVTRLSIDFDPTWTTEPADVVKAVFFGLGSDGTVGANKSSIQILGDETDLYAQGYFVYDSKKAGAVTVSHLRFGPRPIRSTYLIRSADFVACHQFSLLDRLAVVEMARSGGVLLLNAPFAPDEVWENLPREVQEEIVARELKVYTVDAGSVAREAGLGGRINTVMQACFFAVSGVLPRDRALECIQRSIVKKYAKKGEEVVRRNLDALEVSLDHLHEVAVPRAADASRRRPPAVPAEAPDFVQRVTAVMMEGKGDLLPVSAFPVDGSWPTNTARWEKRGIAWSVPVWDRDVCIQCNKCALACPHATIRAKVFEPAALGGAPDGFPHTEFRSKDLPGLEYTLQVAPEDCTGCSLCVAVCPAKNKSNPREKAINMRPLGDVLAAERERYDFFLDIPELDRTAFERFDVKTSQLLLPLFEYSGACAGCGETPYVKLLTQLYGDRLLIANATGCSSIYGGNLPTTPYAVDGRGRGPAWSNSLFEDNAEFGLGFRLAVDGLADRAEMLVRRLAGRLGDAQVAELLGPQEKSERGIAERRERVLALREALKGIDDPDARRLAACADALVRKSVWIVGGDGWAFDIGYGGLDHVLASGMDVNVLVLDTEVYSNTGGQASKATPLGAAAKFASRGKAIDKKDLGLMALSYGHVYVASIAFGAKDAQTVTALQEAESYDGPSLVIAYSHCVAHGYDMAHGADQQKRAVDAGVWPLFRFDPRRADTGDPPLLVDAKGGKLPAAEYMRNEARFRMVEKIDPDGFKRYARGAQNAAERRIAVYQHMAALRFPAAALPAAKPAQEVTE